MPLGAFKRRMKSVSMDITVQPIYTTLFCCSDFNSYGYIAFPASLGKGFFMYFNQKDFGKRLMNTRKVAGMTQEELAEKLSVAKQHISRMERGVVSCSIDLLVDISCVLDVSTDFLLMGKGITSEKEQLNKVIDQLVNISRNL